MPAKWPITFDTPVPEGVTYVGRNHRLIESLAEHLMDQAFYPSGEHSPASRCGAIRTADVTKLTTLLLLRLRYLVYERDNETPTLAEETLAWGYVGLSPNTEPLSLDEARRLLDKATPSANLSKEQKTEAVAEALKSWDALQPQMQKALEQRAQRLLDSHRRVRSLTKQGRVRIEPQSPPDLLGVLVLLPVPGGASR